MSDRRKIVLAQSYPHFLNWCRENDISPMRACYADSNEKIMGLELKPEDIVDLGGTGVDRKLLATRIR